MTGRQSTIQLARDRIFSFNLQSNLIKNLHCRFRENDITISYPVRTLQVPNGWGPEILAGQASATATNGPPRAAGEPPASGPRREFHLRREEEGPHIGDDPPGGERPMGTPDGPDGP